MIARLRGIVESLEAGSCIIDVAGVGYLVHASTRTLSELANGAPASLHIETVIREDAFLLHGFLTGTERDWFRLLTTVQGVGARVALGILSALSPDQLIAAIATQDKAAIARAPGVGPKLALRLVTELREKAGAMPSGGGQVVPMKSTGATADALSALLNLGYRRAEAEAAIGTATATHGDNAALDILIRAGLQALAK
jgi:Holliday junction DNA helicase RuvA